MRQGRLSAAFFSLSYATENCSMRYRRGRRQDGGREDSYRDLDFCANGAPPDSNQANDFFHVHLCVFGVENECLAMKQVCSPCGRIVLNVHSHGCLDRRRLERIRLPQRRMMGLMKCRS
jgi:hypothetical protein